MSPKVAANYLSFGLLVFTVFIISGIIIYPESLSANNGVSFFGVQEQTVLMYTLTFVTNALLAWWVASKFSTKKGWVNKYITYGLVLAGVCYIGLVLTPHTLFSPVHRIFGSSLFALELISCLLILIKYNSDYINKILFTVGFLSGLASLFYLFIINGYMLQSQLIFQVAVWGIIIRFLRSAPAKL